jgi:hypothetical protein
MILGIAGAVTLIQQECLPRPYADYRVFDILPNWTWQAWAILFLLFLLVSAVEALYQYDAEGRLSSVRKPILKHSGEPYERPRIKRGWLSRYMLPSIAVLLIAAYYFHPDIRFRTNTKQRVVNAATKVPASTALEFYPTPLTLRELFDTDFDVFSVTTDNTLTSGSNAHHSLHFSTRTFFDFNSNSIFIAVYIPFNSNAYMTSSILAHKVQHLLDLVEQQIQVGAETPGETAATWSQNMRFSGRVFVYYEGILSLKQLADLESQFEQNGESVEFRGQDYLALHWNEQRRVLQKSCAPGYRLDTQEHCIKK